MVEDKEEEEEDAATLTNGQTDEHTVTPPAKANGHLPGGLCVRLCVS